ncbi:MAG: class I SAM-dependent methyltransferase [Bacteriovoracaceae bacterium]
MKYYEMHEIVYQRIKNDGHLSWDKSSSFDDMWLHGTNTGLRKLLMKVDLDFKDLRVLDLGTGTGTSALYCAKEGAKCVAVEVSKTAIDIALKNAHTLGLDIEFIVGDILDLQLNKHFDLVIDSTVLHCFVGDQDRKSFYETAKRHLNAEGYLFINTMISKGDMSSHFPKEYFYYEDEILWSLGISEISERKMINGKSYFAHRTLLSEQNQIEEFKNNGFEIVNVELVSESEVSCMVALLKLKT